ncbi:MAG: BTB/POZ domain-containing protein [Parachlamydia sp.]|nr:BTB/POZ domain-containing protein [Parachlamydia sp.]
MQNQAIVTVKPAFTYYKQPYIDLSMAYRQAGLGHIWQDQKQSLDVQYKTLQARIEQQIEKAEEQGERRAFISHNLDTSSPELIQFYSNDLFSRMGVNLKEIHRTEKPGIVITWHKDSPCLNTVFPYAHTARMRDYLTDFHLKSGQQEMKFHRLILAARSPYFETLFSKESRDGFVDVSEISPKVLEIWKNYLYTGKTDTIFLRLAELQELTLLADRFQTHFLFDVCMREWLLRIHAKNVQFILEFAFRSDLPALEEIRRACCEFLVESLCEENFEKVSILAEKFDLISVRKACDRFLQTDESIGA